MYPAVCVIDGKLRANTLEPGASSCCDAQTRLERAAYADNEAPTYNERFKTCCLHGIAGTVLRRGSVEEKEC